tara:strand:+ start:441 stop:1433 length:993 start_codon:yes stop_codon:yes gene_type:complete
MNFSLIICTYHRPKALLLLLESVKMQTMYPNQILIIDGSRDDRTKEALKTTIFSSLSYFQVEDHHRGLTKQRNFGISRVGANIDVVCFLDDDVVLERDYFEMLIDTYQKYPEAIGVGGCIKDVVEWVPYNESNSVQYDDYSKDGYVRKLGSRNVLRKKFNLLSQDPPGYMPKFSNGLSTAFLPPSNKTYKVEFFMGGVSSFRKELLNKLKFSEYFEGYGLYEDMDFCLRASKIGKLYVNTAAKLDHYHEPDGRPNQFDYGKMVIRNGWYVWRVKYPNPDFKSKLKWHVTALLLTLVRLSNSLTTSKKQAAFTESMGRIYGWWSLWWNLPK